MSTRRQIHPVTHEVLQREADRLNNERGDLLNALDTALRYLRDPKFDPAMRGAQAFLIEAAIYRVTGVQR